MASRLLLLVCLSAGSMAFAQQDPVISDPSAAKPAVPAPAQTSAPAPLTTTAEDETTTFRASVRNILAPVTVLDRSGSRRSPSISPSSRFRW
jgi:hypothetical protein